MRAGGSWQQPAVLCSAVLRRTATAPVAAGCRVCRRSGAGPSARAGERQPGSPVLCRAPPDQRGGAGAGWPYGAHPAQSCFYRRPCKALTVGFRKEKVKWKYSAVLPVSSAVQL